MAAERHGAGRRYSRWPLYAPFLLLVLFVVGWTAFWFVARDRATEALDAWVAREAALARQWTCPNRAVGGFPFRFELVCNKPSFAGRGGNGGVEGSIGRVLVAAQVYDPSLVIVEADGPLMLRAGDETAELGWTTLRASLRGRGTFERGSLVATGPVLRLKAGEAAIARAESLEAHLRRDPGRPEADGAYELVAKLGKASAPAVDAFVDGPEPVEAALRATITQGDAFGRGPVIAQIERWRIAGGELNVRLLSLTKGARRLEGKGVFSLDDEHRPRGEIEAAAAGLEDLIRRLLGRQRGLAGLLAGGLDAVGRGQRRAGDRGATLVPLPPVRVVNGRALFGPVALFAVPPLY